MPSGATSFHVADAGGFAPGDTIQVRRPVTAAWVKFTEDPHAMETRDRLGISPGRYRLTLSAEDPAGNDSKKVTRRFTVLR